jgi:hypothetical protein
MCGREIRHTSEYRWMYHKSTGSYLPPRICNTCEEWGKVEYRIQSSKSERLRIARKNNVIWNPPSERGNGICIPQDEDLQRILWEYGQGGVLFTDGIPDFSPFAEMQVMIGEITPSRNNNIRKAYKRFAKDFAIEDLDGSINIYSVEAQVIRLCKLGCYTWHECNDRKTMQLIPTVIHQYFNHLGGVSEAKRARKKQGKERT